MFRVPMFWILTILGFTLLSLNKAITFQSYMAKSLDPEVFKFSYFIIVRLLSLFTLVIPLLVFYLIFDKKKLDSFYGLTIKKVNLKAYLSLIPILAIFTFLGSFSDNFLAFYPRFESSGYETFIESCSIKKWVAVLIFEIIYGSYFVRVELFFRGFLILGLTKYIGKDTILPMVAIYCVLHFGKPIGEAITAIFGGYFIGVITYYSKNIFGGIIWHISIAWFMELFAYYQMFSS